MVLEGGGGGERGGGGGVPPLSAEAVCSAFRRSSHAESAAAQCRPGAQILVVYTQSRHKANTTKGDKDKVAPRFQHFCLLH